MNLLKAPLILGLGLCVSTLAFAQAGLDGGGRFTEADFKIFQGELVAYFNKAESRSLYPVVDTWEKTTGAKFDEFLAAIEPKVVNQKVYGPFGEERDCVSKHEGAYRYFECNSERVPENRLENQATLYVMILHEAFVHAGIEPAGPETIPSHYPESSKIGLAENLHRVVIHTERMVPGSEKRATPKTNGFFCSSDVEWNSQTAYELYWIPNGDYFLTQIKVPLAHRFYNKKLQYYLSGKVKIRLLARGNKKLSAETGYGFSFTGDSIEREQIYSSPQAFFWSTDMKVDQPTPSYDFVGRIKFSVLKSLPRKVENNFLVMSCHVLRSDQGPGGNGGSGSWLDYFDSLYELNNKNHTMKRILFKGRPF